MAPFVSKQKYHAQFFCSDNHIDLLLILTCHFRCSFFSHGTKLIKPLAFVNSISAYLTTDNSAFNSCSPAASFINLWRTFLDYWRSLPNLLLRRCFSVLFCSLLRLNPAPNSRPTLSATVVCSSGIEQS